MLKRRGLPAAPDRVKDAFGKLLLPHDIDLIYQSSGKMSAK
jgi:hypothetical protein